MGPSELQIGRYYLSVEMILDSVETLNRSARTKSAAMLGSTPAK